MDYSLSRYNILWDTTIDFLIKWLDFLVIFLYDNFHVDMIAYMIKGIQLGRTIECLHQRL